MDTEGKHNILIHFTYLHTVLAKYYNLIWSNKYIQFVILSPIKKFGENHKYWKSQGIWWGNKVGTLCLLLLFFQKIGTSCFLYFLSQEQQKNFCCTDDSWDEESNNSFAEDNCCSVAISSITARWGHDDHETSLLWWR